jgi:hypothetical protein
MASAEIDVIAIQAAVNAVLDHLIEDLQIEKIQIDNNDVSYP